MSRKDRVPGILDNEGWLAGRNYRQSGAPRFGDVTLGAVAVYSPRYVHFAIRSSRALGGGFFGHFSKTWHGGVVWYGCTICEGRISLRYKSARMKVAGMAGGGGNPNAHGGGGGSRWADVVAWALTV